MEVGEVEEVVGRGGGVKSKSREERERRIKKKGRRDVTRVVREKILKEMGFSANGTNN